MTVAVNVVDISIERTETVTLTFDDGVVCVFSVRELRAECPCATCRTWRDRGEIAWPRPGQSDTIAVVDAELVGAWGISLHWSDGHETGIYAFEHLHRWWTSGLDAPDWMP